MSSPNTISPSTDSPKAVSENPGVDGVLSITGPYGKCIVQLALSGESNSAHIETKIGQRHYTIDIRPTLSLVMPADPRMLEIG